ncbi:MAG: hypothetical protein HFI65_02825, partial [Lachnospiraceae bacterium]|nr:hypothetical protein [Lachnospiraceae bacterium]
MISSVFRQAAEMLRKRRKNKWWLAAFLCLAAVAVVGTVMVLKPTGRAKTREERTLACKYAVHQHTEGCYAAGENGKELVCGYADFVIHQHAEGCYDAAGSLACALPEVEAHVHEAGCFEEDRTLVCGMLDGDGGHVHTEACYGEAEKILICGQEESEEHTHTEECYQTGEAPLICGTEAGAGGHVHTEECFQVDRRLICTKPEARPHIHDGSCYEKDENGNEIRICGLLQVEEHVHRDDCFEVTEVAVDEAEAPGESPAEAESAGETESIEETESAGETESVEETESVGETESASETGPEGSETAEPVWICGLEEHTHTEECRDESGEPICGLEEHVHNEACAAPEEEKEYLCGLEEHTHTEACYDENGELTCGLEEHAHTESCLAGPEEITQTWQNERYIIKATYTAAAGLPENALLQAEEITEESDPEKYAEREAEARDLLDEVLSMRGLFKIGFYVDGAEVEPKDTVGITIQFLDENGYAEGEPIKVIHFAEEKPEVLEASQVDGEGATSFEAGSFSEYLVVGESDPENVGTFQELKGLIETMRDGEELVVKLSADIRATEAVRLPANTRVTLDLNGKTITVASGDSLFNVMDNSSLTITDGSGTVADVRDGGKPWDGYGWKGAGDWSGDTLTYHEIDSVPDGKGGTSETLYTHTVTGGGKIIRDEAQTVASPLIFVMSGTFTLQGGMLNGSGLGRAVVAAASTGSIDKPLPTLATNVLNLEGGYICNCKAAFDTNVPKSDIRNWNGGAVLDASGYGTVNLSGTVIANNTALDDQGECKHLSCGWNVKKDGVHGNGGGIAMVRGGVLNITGGIVTGNQSSKYGKGGGIYTSGGVTVNMSGGNLCNNRDDYRTPGDTYQDRADEYNQYDGGGGILIGSNGTLKMTGGQIAGNSGAGGGGIQTTSGGSELYISGGIIARNLAEVHEGGGLVTVGAGGYAQVIAGGAGTVYVTNNKTATAYDWGGGGMFCVESAHLVIQSALITGNEAQGFGGGVGGCSNAQIYDNVGPLTLENGTAVYHNTAAGTGVTNAYYHEYDFDDAGYALGDPVFTQDERYQDYYCEQYSTVKNQMLGGGTSDWVGSYKNTDEDSRTVDFKAEQIDGISSSDRMGLNANPTPEAVEAAAARASVYITGNQSTTHGGGVQCNGLLVLGDYDGASFSDSLQIRAGKKLMAVDGKEKVLTGKEFTFELNRYVDGKETPIRNVENGKDGVIDFGTLSVSGNNSSGVSTVQYVIREKPGTDHAGILRDSTEYLVTIPVAGYTETIRIGQKTYTKRQYTILDKEPYNGNGELYHVTVQKWSDEKKNWGDPVIMRLERGSSGEKILNLTEVDASFTNWEIENKNIVVTKEWNGGSATQEALKNVESVTVTLYKKKSTDDGTTWAEDGTETADLNEGNSWTKKWEDLPVRDSRTPDTVYDYEVKETEIRFTDGTTQTFDEKNRTENFKSEAGSKTDAAANTETITFTNTHVDDLTYSLQLCKKAGDAEGNATASTLAGAEFALFREGSEEALRFSGSGGTYTYAADPKTDGTTTTLVTDENGYILIHGLPAGTYQFEETKAPLGYVIAENIQPVTVTMAKVEDVATRPGGQTIEVVSVEVVDPLYYYEIPESGGVGTGRYMTLGGVLFLLTLGIGGFCLGKK